MPSRPWGVVALTLGMIGPMPGRPQPGGGAGAAAGPRAPPALRRRPTGRSRTPWRGRPPGQGRRESDTGMGSVDVVVVLKEKKTNINRHFSPFVCSVIRLLLTLAGAT